MKVLYATDGSEESAYARHFLAALRLPPGSEIVVLSVMADPVPLAGPYAGVFAVTGQTLFDIREAEREVAQKALEEAAAELAAEGVRISVALRDGEPAREILTAAEELGADLTVVGSRGLTGLDAFLLGSIARNVAKHSRRPVVVAREPRGNLREVVLAADGSDHSRHAADLTAHLPLAPETRVTVVHVLRPYQPFPGLFPTDRAEYDQAVEEFREQQREHASAILRDTRERVAAAGCVVETELREGDPATQILSAAEERGADLVIAGARGVSLVQGLFVGSVADRLLKETRCSILIVP